MRSSQQGGDLVARLHHLHQQIAILRIRPVVELFIQTPAQLRVITELQYWENVRIVGRDDDLAIGPRLVSINVILRQSLELAALDISTLRWSSAMLRSYRVTWPVRSSFSCLSRARVASSLSTPARRNSSNDVARSSAWSHPSWKGPEQPAPCIHRGSKSAR